MLYIAFFFVKIIIKNIKDGKMKDEKGKFLFTQSSLEIIAYQVIKSKEHLEKHICWIFWITLSLFITSLNT
jgi:hypothetical protein